MGPGSAGGSAPLRELPAASLPPYRSGTSGPPGAGRPGAMARAPQSRRRPAAPGSALRALLRCNLPPGAQRVVVFAVLALLVLINVVLIFLLAFR